MESMVDLRSDTVTRPTDAMRRAMAEAEVGDDVYGEDPTVNRLQDVVADLLGKDAALFVPSGTMANQICLHVLTDRGDEVVLEKSSHVYNYETGASSVLSGVQLHPVDDGGLLTPDGVEAAIRPDMDVFARTRVVSVENTANKAGGRVYPIDRIAAVTGVARDHGLKTHLDGARLWNASAASGVSEAEYASHFDLVWVALSKGLGAPAGSLVAGPQSLIDEARRVRKRFGGGMRQSGILAAAGLHALEHHRPHLSDDHTKARRLARALADLAAFDIDPQTVESNIVLFDVVDGMAQPVIDAMADDGILLTPFGPRTVRATTHRDVSDDDVDAAIEAFQKRYDMGVTTG